MARNRSRALTPREAELIQLLRLRGEATVEELHRLSLTEAVEPLNANVIRTMLSVLQRKGHVVRCRKTRCFYYRPTFSLIAAVIRHDMISKVEFDAVQPGR